MARPGLFILVAAGLLAAPVCTSHGHDGLQRDGASHSSVNGTQQAITAGDNDAVEEAPESPDPRSRELRRAKDTRYNIGGRYLTVRKPNTEYFNEHVWPRGLPLIPASESAVVVTGRAIRMQPHLSQDRSQIYTEISVEVEEVLKSNKKDSLRVGGTVIVDRPGGALKLKSGEIIRDDIVIEGLGKTRVGGRYLLFTERIHKGQDLRLIKGYELRDAKVFRLSEDGSSASILVSTSPGVPETYSQEQAFLEAVRQAVRSKTVK